MFVLLESKTEISNCEPYRAQIINTNEWSNGVVRTRANLGAHSPFPRGSNSPSRDKCCPAEMLAKNYQRLIFPRDARTLNSTVKYPDSNIGNLPRIITKGWCTSTKQDTQSKSEAHIPLGNHQFLTSDLARSRYSADVDQMNCISILQMGIWNAVIVTQLRAPSVNWNPVPRSSSNLSPHLSLSLESYWQMFSQSITVISQLWHLQVRRTHQQLSGGQTIMIPICQTCCLCPLHMQLHPQVRNPTNKWLLRPFEEQPWGTRSWWKLTQLKNHMVTQSLKTMPSSRIIKTGIGIVNCLWRRRVISSIEGI